LRARVPLVARIVALVLLAAGIGFVGASYYKLRNTPKFVPSKNRAELSKDIAGIIEGYERQVTKDNRLYLLVKASRDITYSDLHHELENVSIAVYPAVGNVPDFITANRAITQHDNSVITFLGNVKIETKDKLKVSTESLSLDQTTEVAQTDSPVTFERENVSGRSTGAVVEQKVRKLELKKDVEITVSPRPGTDNAKPSATSRPVTIKAAHGIFEHESLKLSFSGGVTAEQASNIMSGDTLNGLLNQQKQLQHVEVRGNSYLRTMEPGRAAEVHGIDMDFHLDKDQRLERAVVRRDIRAATLDADSEMKLTGSNELDVWFQAKDDRSLLREMFATGRSVITLSAPKSKINDKRAANKRLSADTVKLIWHSAGRDLDYAEAKGNAELFVEPVTKTVGNETKTLTAPQFNCSFFELGNLTKSCYATGGTKAVLDPVQPDPKRGTRTLTSQKMNAAFVKETQDVERLDAEGDAKFNENDRNGIAATASYTAADQTLRLRGGEPTVWDSRGRTKGSELDSDLANKISYSRGRTTTTYYSQEQTNGATPFSKVKSPVYVVADRAELRHEAGIATYIGNARAWQDDNFVRGDKLNLYLNDKTMDATGRVQTAIYNSKRRVDNNVVMVPVFASSDTMSYSDPNRVVHYEGNVDIKQGTDRLTGGVADAYLSRETNEMVKTIAQRGVVLTQPTRKGTGDWVEYTAVDEIAVLKGNPARVEDNENGNTQGARLTLSIRDSKVTADDARGPLSPGRIRSTHKIKKP
jgi:LPS export ABC transporter protein LptC/lipopolysaccharide transport protein LptA